MIGQIIEFATDLRNLGEKANSEILTTYSRELSSFAENFNVEELMKKLKTFPEIIEQLKARSGHDG